MKVVKTVDELRTNRPRKFELTPGTWITNDLSYLKVGGKIYCAKREKIGRVIGTTCNQLSCCCWVDFEPKYRGAFKCYNNGYYKVDPGYGAYPVYKEPVKENPFN